MVLCRVFRLLWINTFWVSTLEVSEVKPLVLFFFWFQTRAVSIFLLFPPPADATLNEAAQILRLLHIEELRELQTKINEAIVAVQAIIADPKTDHRLGKVGR